MGIDNGFICAQCSTGNQILTISRKDNIKLKKLQESKQWTNKETL